MKYLTSVEKYFQYEIMLIIQLSKILYIRTLFFIAEIPCFGTYKKIRNFIHE